MYLFYQILMYFQLVLFLAMMIMAFTWQRRKGKWLICSAMTIVFLSSIIHVILNSIDMISGSGVPSKVYLSLSITGNVLFHVSSIFLLFFLIVSRRVESPVGSSFASGGELGFGQAPPQGFGGDIEGQPVDSRLVGIGGWLILPAIGIILGIIASIAGLVMSIAVFEEVADAGYGEFFTASVVVDFALFVYLVVIAFFFFGKKRAAPKMIIIMILLNFITSLIFVVLALGMDAEELAVGHGKALVQSFIGGCIWIPYFCVSKRVKVTFVN